jgi:arylsulfatase A-like enzyme
VFVKLHPIQTILGIVVTLASWHQSQADQNQVSASRPNILLIVADDLGWSDVGWHGGFSKTPHLDKLVLDGIDLDQHYVQPVCTPTRTALMSGRCPGGTYAVFVDTSITGQDKSLGEALVKAGQKTVLQH